MLEEEPTRLIRMGIHPKAAAQQQQPLAAFGMSSTFIFIVSAAESLGLKVERHI